MREDGENARRLGDAGHTRSDLFVWLSVIQPFRFDSRLTTILRRKVRAKKTAKRRSLVKSRVPAPFYYYFANLAKNTHHTRARLHAHTRTHAHAHTRYRGLRSDFGRKVQKTARISLILNEKLALHSRKRTANPFAKKSPLAVKRAGWWSGMAVVVRLPKVAVYTRG